MDHNINYKHIRSEHRANLITPHWQYPSMPRFSYYDRYILVSYDPTEAS